MVDGQTAVPFSYQGNDYTGTLATPYVTEATAAYTELKAGAQTNVTAFEGLANADLSTQALVDSASVAKGLISLDGINAADKLAFQTRIDAASVKVVAAQQTINDATAYATVVAGVETKVAAYETLATGDLTTQALVDSANTAKSVIILNAGLKDADVTAFQGRVDAATVKVAAAQKIIDDAAYATLKAGVETNVVAYETLANADLSTQALVDGANVAKTGIVLQAGLTDSDKTAFQGRIDAATVKVTAAQTKITDAIAAEVKAEEDATVAVKALTDAAAADLKVEANIAIAEGLVKPATDAIANVKNETVSATLTASVTTATKTVTDARKVITNVEASVSAYEAATIAKYNDIKVATDLKTAAVAAVGTVTDVTAKAAFTKRITDKQTTIDATLLAKVKAVDDADATNQIDLLASLSFFNNVDANKIAAYDTILLGTQTTVAQIQLAVDSVNDSALVNAATNQIQMLAALRSGVSHSVFTDVNEAFIVQYSALIGTTGTGHNSAAQIQVIIANANATEVGNAAAAITAATNLVVTAEAAPSATTIANAQTLVTALPADIAPATTKTALEARLTALAPVAPVLAAKTLNDQILLNIALQSSSYVRVNSNLMVDYMGQIVAANDITVTLIQSKIDAANVAAATTAVNTAVAPGLTTAKVTTAQGLVSALPADVAPATVKSDLQTRLNVVSSLISVDGTVTTFGVTDAAVVASLQANATVLGLTINPALGLQYKTAILAAGAQVTRDTAAEVVALVNGVNGTIVTDATNSVIAAEGTLLTAAKVTTAQALVTSLPADVAPATVKVDLQTRLNVVNALLAVDAAVTAPGATDASVLAVLQANATVLGIKDLNAPYASYYRTSLAGAQTVRDTATEVQGIITTTVNVARAGVAATAVTTAETPGITAANVALAQVLVTAMPTLTPNTAKAALQTKLDVVNALLAIDTAVNVSGATDASVLTSLQANATLLGLTGPNALNTNLAYKTALGALTTRDTVAKLIIIVNAVNSPSTALTALVTPGADAAAELVKIKAKTLNLTNVVDTNASAYFVDAAAFTTAAGTTAAAVQNVVNAVNALVQLNAATTATDAKAAVTTFALNVTHANSTTYINLSSTEKLELSQMMVTDIAANGSYTDIAALTAKIASLNTTRTGFVTAVNSAKTTGTITAMNTALSSLAYAPYDALDASTKLNVAEKFLTNFPMTTATTPVVIPYTTITGIQAGIDAAIK